MKAPIRVLIADDDETFLHSTADLLRKASYQCECAPDGPAARALLEQLQPDVLVSDINMPGNGQLQLIESLAEGEFRIPVILVTGYPSVESAVRSIRLPVAAYLLKPLEFDELRESVDAAAKSFRTVARVREVRERLVKLASEMHLMEENNAYVAGRVHTPPDDILQHSLGELLEMLLPHLHIEKGQAGNPARHEMSNSIEGPRERMLRRALRDTVKVLENTKRSFRSKELAALRRSIVDLLDGDV